jgi:hypothetical protein
MEYFHTNLANVISVMRGNLHAPARPKSASGHNRRCRLQAELVRHCFSTGNRKTGHIGACPVAEGATLWGLGVCRYPKHRSDSDTKVPGDATNSHPARRRIRAVIDSQQLEDLKHHTPLRNAWSRARRPLRWRTHLRLQRFAARTRRPRRLQAGRTFIAPGFSQLVETAFRCHLERC